MDVKVYRSGYFDYTPVLTATFEDGRTMTFFVETKEKLDRVLEYVNLLADICQTELYECSIGFGIKVNVALTKIKDIFSLIIRKPRKV